jgi:hypothetical protein
METATNKINTKNIISGETDMRRNTRTTKPKNIIFFL